MACAYDAAAITGLRKRGYAVTRERSDAGEFVYRISVAPDGSEDRVAVQTAASPRPPSPQAEDETGGVIGVGRAEAKSGQAAKRPMAATSGASLPPNLSVLSIVADLEGRDLNGLRRQWRTHLGGEAPAHLPRWLLMRVLAYRLQSNAFGDLDKSIRRNLRSEKDDGAGVPFDRRTAQTRQGVALKAGALLVREWKGRLERVMILEEGFAWNGQTFGSLSQIAKR